MSNVAFDVTRYYQIAQDTTGTQYIVQDGNWFSQKTQAATLIVPAGWKFLPQGASATYPGLLPNVLAQSGFPMIMPPNSTSLSAAGALVLATALDLTYANCYMFFPANAVATVSAAGMYFVQMSSTTAGTVFQNTYTSGVPVIPAASALIPCTTASSYTQTTGANVTILSFTIPGGSMGPNGQVRYFVQYRNNNSAGNKIHGASFGGTTIVVTTVTTNGNIPIQRNIFNRGVTNSQVCQVQSSNGIAASSGTPPAISVDTTAAVTLLILDQLAVATDWAMVDSLLIEILPGA